MLRNPYRGGSRSAVEFWVWGLGFFSSACVCILVAESLGLGVEDSGFRFIRGLRVVLLGMYPFIEA